MFEKGKSMMVWKPDKNKWKIYRPVWNDDPNKKAI